MKKALKAALGIVQDAFAGWSAHKAPRMGAALSYYTAFAVGPVIVLVVVIASLFLGHDAANGRVFGELEGYLGPDAASGVQGVVAAAGHRSTSVVAMIASIVSLIFGATGVFGELHDALNTIWGVKLAEHRPLVAMLRERFLSLTMVAGTGFLLLASLLVSALLSILGRWLSATLPGGEVVWEILNSLISLIVVTGVFALLFKLVPDVKMRWREPLIAAAVTAVLFTLGKLGLGLYLAHAGVATMYGAAGSIVVLLLWVFYAAQIVYFGAELSRALTRALGAAVLPTRGATAVLAVRRRRHARGSPAVSRRASAHPRSSAPDR